MNTKQKKELIQQSYGFGMMAFGHFGCAPFENINFMNSIPNCDFGDKLILKLRISMYKSYIAGWTFMNLIQKAETYIENKV